MQSIVLPTHCYDDHCGMVSAIRYYEDGSYRIFLDACVHAKKWPGLTKVRAAIEKQNHDENATA